MGQKETGSGSRVRSLGTTHKSRINRYFSTLSRMVRYWAGRVSWWSLVSYGCPPVPDEVGVFACPGPKGRLGSASVRSTLSMFEENVSESLYLNINNFTCRTKDTFLCLCSKRSS